MLKQQAGEGSEDDYIPVSDLSNAGLQQHEVADVEAFWDSNPQLEKLTTWTVSAHLSMAQEWMSP